MNINRHNYEELFLMYVDNELSQAQRTEVEVFVQQNPDLSEELASLQNAILVPGDVAFEGKEVLYKDEHSINIKNYEQYFLLDVDNELTATGKIEVEKFVLQHPELQDEFTLLHQTKLPVEVIEFKGKDLLYRTERKERRVIVMSFKRFAVAASVIGLIATLWMVYPGNESNVQTIASSEKPNIGKTEKVITQQPTPTTDNKIVNTLETIDANKNVVAAKKAPSTYSRPLNNNNVSENKLPVIEAKREDEVLAYNNTKREEEVENTRPIEISANESGVITQTANNATEASASLIQPAVYREANYDDEEKSFYIGSVELNKNKLRGLFKKASTLFDKKAKTGDSDRTVQIASFEIKTK